MISGKNIIGFQSSDLGHVKLHAVNAVTQEVLDGTFVGATVQEVAQAVQMAKTAHQSYAKTTPVERAAFLEAIADEIENIGDALLERASLESGLPLGRFQGERGRTCGQLRLFAQVVREGSWVEATIDTADAGRSPLPKPDVRKMLVASGPIVVFTASNFPLAFSTAGSDTASALAAGCPVIVKAHEAHLGTNELVAQCIKRAAEKTGMPDGVFSSLNGDGFKTGEQLVNHPDIKGVAFTGSGKGGMALYQMAQNRKVPIPVFAEMGSVNPVILLPEKLKKESAAVAEAYAGSITLGVGQFCTNPGLLIGIASPELQDFKSTLSGKLNETSAATMLTSGIEQHFEAGKRRAIEQVGVSKLTQDNGQATLAVVSSDAFLSNSTLHEEIFGPMSILVECPNETALMQVINSLEGQLTGTLIADGADMDLAIRVSEVLQERVGRILWNGAPTGVEVGHAMHHGGPFPATTDCRFTSVGVDAIKRFARPLCYQNFPDNLLPDALKQENVLNILRKIDGRWVVPEAHESNHTVPYRTSTS